MPQLGSGRADATLLLPLLEQGAGLAWQGSRLEAVGVPRAMVAAVAAAAAEEAAVQAAVVRVARVRPRRGVVGRVRHSRCRSSSTPVWRADGRVQGRPIVEEVRARRPSCRP